MYDIFDIVLTEAKKLDIVSGINQNLLQQHASLEFLSDLFTSKTNLGKRRREEFEEIYKDLKSVSTAGIITTGKQWIFIKIVSNNGSRKVYRSNELSLNLNSNDITIPVSSNSSTSLSVQLRSFTQQVTKLMKVISQLILDQIQEIHLKGNVLQKYHEMYKVNPTTNVLEYQLARAESFYAVSLKKRTIMVMNSKWRLRYHAYFTYWSAFYFYLLFDSKLNSSLLEDLLFLF